MWGEVCVCVCSYNQTQNFISFIPLCKHVMYIEEASMLGIFELLKFPEARDCVAGVPAPVF